MPQAAFSSRVLDRNRNALAAIDADYWVMDKGPSLVYAANLQMTGGTTLASTDAYSHAWYYADLGLGFSRDIDQQTDLRNNVTDTTLVNGAVMVLTSWDGAQDVNSVEALREIVNTGSTAFSSPATDLFSGQNAESQVGFNCAGVQDLDGRVVVTTIRTSISGGGGGETAMTAKLRFPKPPTDYSSFPNPAMMAGR